MTDKCSWKFCPTRPGMWWQGPHVSALLSYSKEVHWKFGIGEEMGGLILILSRGKEKPPLFEKSFIYSIIPRPKQSSCWVLAVSMCMCVCVCECGLCVWLICFVVFWFVLVRFVFVCLFVWLVGWLVVWFTVLSFNSSLTGLCLLEMVCWLDVNADAGWRG